MNQYKKAVITISITLIIGIAATLSWLTLTDEKDPEDTPTTQLEVEQPTVTEEVTNKNKEDDEEEQKEQYDAEQIIPVEQSRSLTDALEVNVLECGLDCTLVPVDKDNQIPTSYNPGGIINSAQDDFNRLTAAASNAGHLVEVVSGFRSYSTQETTFEYWVGQEILAGKNRAQAEIDANVYSAKPGHSEHQLGTTFDIKCVGCISFDATSNASLYTFIEDNAHEYGFIISYPKNSAHLTGYTYEPWHIRWIGEELATKLYNTGYTDGNGNYLTKFLREEGY